VLGFVLLHAGNGHGHAVEDLLFLSLRQTPKPRKRTGSVPFSQELRLQPVMLGTAYPKVARRGHRAPVENAEKQSNIKGEEKANIILALDLPNMPVFITTSTASAAMLTTMR
jgi:hypothetical protein